MVNFNLMEDAPVSVELGEGIAVSDAKPLVARLAPHPNRRHSAANDSSPFFATSTNRIRSSTAGLHPSHRQGPPRRSVDLLPMSPVYSVTDIADSDSARLLSRRLARA